MNLRAENLTLSKTCPSLYIMFEILRVFFGVFFFCLFWVTLFANSIIIERVYDLLIRRVLVVICSIVSGISAAIVETVITGPPDERLSIVDPWFWLFMVPFACIFMFGIFWICESCPRSLKKLQNKLTIEYQELKNQPYLSQETIYDMLLSKLRSSKKDLYRIETDGIGKVLIFPRSIHIT